MISRYDPFRETISLRRAMDQLFEGSFVHPNAMSGSSSLMVPMDVCETTNGYEVDVAVPGARLEDIELMIDQNTLTIRGRYGYQNQHQDQSQTQSEGGQSQQQPSSQARGQQEGQQTPPSQPPRAERHSQGHNWLLREIVSGSFERSITFPKPIDPNNIQTNFENGILTILVPVSQESHPRRISITGQRQQRQEAIGAGRS